MQARRVKETSLSVFFKRALEEKREEVKDIVEMQRILEELARSEERPQIYQIKVTSNW